MKLLIAIILMVLTGVCFADVGDYRLNGEDNARIESVVTDNCEKTAVLVGGDRLARVEIEYIATLCKPVVLVIIYDRFDDIAAIPLKVTLKKVLKENSDEKINLLNKMGDLAGRIVAEQYLGMSFE